MIADESSALLTSFAGYKVKKPSIYRLYVRRYRSAYICISSKAALLTLIWSFVASTASQLLIQPENYTYLVPAKLLSLIYVGNAFVLCFYPLAGLLADNKFGRYNSVVWSLYVMLALFGISYFALAFLLPVFLMQSEVRYFWVVAAVLFVPLTISFILFNANVIQFGMDQLHDSPGDHQTLFIHWFVWLLYLGICISQVGSKLAFFPKLGINVFQYVGGSFMLVISILSVGVLVYSVWVGRHRKRWFLVDSARLNPYKLVYRVTKFARQHKVPVNRSAFTYCEDELPAGLDLGKAKYGGPFTTEQVEDVKAFYGILKVLFSLTPAFFVNVATDAILPSYAKHILNPATFESNSTVETIKDIVIYNGLLSSLLSVVSIPLYLFFIRPFVSPYVPGMLKRLGIGIGVVVLSLVCTFVMDTVAHAQDKSEVACMLSGKQNNSLEIVQDASVLVVQRSLASLSNVLIHVALFEFLCSQSPHSMKGLLIGLSFALRGVCDMLSSLTIIPFSFMHVFFPSCGMIYYIMNIVVGMTGLILYICVARKYRFRERDEPCHVRRYAEEYYSKLHPPPSKSVNTDEQLQTSNSLLLCICCHQGAPMFDL